MLNQNPTQYVDLPKRQKTEMQALSQEQSEALLEAAKTDRLYTFFAVMLGTGLRPGEAVALMWKDFDPMTGTLTIQRSYGDVGERDDFKPTKTAKGRQIKLPDNLMGLLLEHKEKQLFKSDLLFPTVNDTAYNERNIVNRHFKPLLEKAKLGEYITVKNDKSEDVLKFTSPYRLYDLRHTHATLLLKAGVNPKIVSERLGHSSVRITLDIYSHILPGMQDEAASKLDGMLTFRRSVNEVRVAN